MERTIGFKHMTKIVQLGLVCSELKEKAISNFGAHMGFGFEWIYVTGGALTVGYYDMTWRDRTEYGVGLPGDLLYELTTEIDKGIQRAFGNEDELNVRVFEAFMHRPCVVDSRLKDRRIRAEPLVQAPQTLLGFLELNKARRRTNKRPRLSLEKLRVDAFDLGNILLEGDK